MSRGRPPAVENKLVVESILKYKEQIICGDEENSIVLEKNSVWQLISEDLGNKIKPASLYSYVVNNRFNLKTLLVGTNDAIFGSTDTTCNASSTINSDANTTNNSECHSGKKNNIIFTLTFGKSEFNELIIQAVRNYKDKKGKRRIRTINVLNPEKWTEIMSKKIYDDYHLNHGYHFENNYINSDKKSGGFRGHCKCGSQLECQILPSLDQEEIIKIRCKAFAGTRACGKRQCRGQNRKTIVSEFSHESVESFRSRMANKLMQVGDSSEPPHLYSASVLRNAKYQMQKKKYLDPNPMIALSKYKKSQEGQNIVRDIVLDPVKVLFWSPHQNRLYNTMIKDADARLCIDATGKLVKHVIHVDGEKSQHIFLYFGVLHSSNAQFVVTSMFSERQDTVTICTWLMRWIQSGAENPKEVVCDSSKALLNACCWTFAQSKTIEMYAESCMSEKLPQTYIRIDVAHYMKNWADFFKTEKKAVKQFYLFSIGQLILCRNKIEATRIIEALLIISQSETAGDGAASLKDSIDFIKNLIKSTPLEVVEIVDSILEEENGNLAPDAEQLAQEKSQSEIKGFLQDWATSINKKVEKKLRTEKGDDLNPRHCPKVATRLLEQMKTIPVWSCICRDNFGYGRVPGSSAPVESEFKNIKQLIMTNTERIDLAVKSLVNYYNGKLKLIDCSKKSTKEVHENITNKCPAEVEDSTNSITPVGFHSPANKSSITEDSSERSPLKNLDFNYDYEISTISPKVQYQLSESTKRVPSERSPLKDLSFQLNQNTCLACKNGDFGSGSHKCIVCQSNVHLLEGCSVEIEGEEEGHGQRRLCIACSQSSTRNVKIALNDVENWRDLGRPKKKVRRALYLSKTNKNLDDLLASSKCRILPIIKNGNDPKLKFVILEKEKISLTNTCPLDSIFQILLAGVTDNEKVRQYVEQDRFSNDLFDMVYEASEKQIQKSTYQRRARIFLKYLNKMPQPKIIESIDCSCNVVSFANFLFKSTPSFQEVSICQAGCRARIKSLPTFTITQKEFDKTLGDVIREHVILPGVRCRQNDCKEMEINQIHKVGNIVVIGVDMDAKIELQAIAKSFICPKSGETYTLLGAVEYRGSPVVRRTSRPGHYVAVARRNINWHLYDDLQNKATKVTKSYKLCVELLIYARN